MSLAQTSSASGGRAGRTIRGYRLLGAIGRGGMATVYLARQGDLRRLVALKELAVLHATEGINAERFLREARVAASLSHPAIVTVYDFFENDGTPFIAMEYVPGGTLRPQVGGLSLAQTVGMLESVLAGLAHAEQHGIVHRDIKPENLMVASDGRVKITDFGIAKATGAVQTASMRTATGTTIGTPNYMAPEQAMGQQVGPWTDLYSLGIVSFEMLVGRTPFYDSDSAMSMVFRQVNEPIPPVRELEPDVDPAVSSWIERLVEKDPASRPQSAKEAWDELEDAAIAALGARWRDDSRLVPAPPPELDTSALAAVPAATLARTVPTNRKAGANLQGTAARGPTRDTNAVTVAADAASEPRARRRRRPLVVLVVLLLLAIAAAASAFAGGGSGGSSHSPTATPSQNSSSSPPSGGPSSSSSPPSGGPSSSSSPPSGSSSSSSPPSGGPSSSSSPPSGSPSSSSSPPSGGPSSSSSPPSGGPRGESSGGKGEGEGCAGDSRSDDPSDDSCNKEP